MKTGDAYRKAQNIRNRRFYIKNEKKIKEQRQCACGGKYTMYNKSKHFNTQKHKKFLDS